VPLIGRSIAAEYPAKVRIRYIRIGDLALLSFPGEMGTGLGARIRGELAGEPGGPADPWIVTLADDYLGYAFGPEDYRHGGHSQHLTIYGEELGDVVRTRSIEIARVPFRRSS